MLKSNTNPHYSRPLIALALMLAFSAFAVPMGQAPVRRHSQPEQPELNPWPDPRFRGYQQVDLEVQFFCVQSASIRAAIPSLLESTEPIVIGSNEVSALQMKLQQANAKPVTSSEMTQLQQFSGGRFHYRIDGAGFNFVHYQTKDSADGTIITNGAEIFLATDHGVSNPLDFTVVPWIENDSVRCQMELVHPKEPQAVEQVERSIPSGSAMLWLVSNETASGKCRFFLLSQRHTEIAPANVTVTVQDSVAESAAQSLEPLRDWIRKQKAAAGTTNLSRLSALPSTGVPRVIVRAEKDSSSISEGLEPTPGRQIIIKKLDQIRLNVEWSGQPLSRVVKDLNDQSKKRDLEKKGISFLIDPHGASEAFAAVIDPHFEPAGCSCRANRCRRGDHKNPARPDGCAPCRRVVSDSQSRRQANHLLDRRLWGGLLAQASGATAVVHEMLQD